MKQLLVFLFTTALLGASCLKSDSEKRTFEYFSNHLKADMNFNDIKKTFGEPDEDIGRGIHIYIYKLKDGSEIGIGYTDKILYAKHVGRKREVIHRII